ncbi:3-keto-disaccharide hydrolase [Spirosoma montaniterrae]
MNTDCFKILFTLTCCFWATLSVMAQPDKREWEPLFNGKDLTGWDIKIAGQPLNDNYKNTFRVENGILRIRYDEYDKFDGKYGHLYYNKPFSHYIVRFTYRFVGDQTKGGAPWNVRNSGVMVHSQSAQSLSMKQDFPVSLEVQLLGGLGKGARHTGNLCTPGTQVFMDGKLNSNHCIDSDSKTYDGDQWVTAEAIVLGDSVVHHVVEGDTVLTYQRPEVGGGFVSAIYGWKQAGVDNADYWMSRQNTPLGEGYIALQAESHPIDFRRVEILNLKGCTDPKALNYKSYYVKSDTTQCWYKK